MQQKAYFLCAKLRVHYFFGISQLKSPLSFPEHINIPKFMIGNKMCSKPLIVMKLMRSEIKCESQIWTHN